MAKKFILTQSQYGSYLPVKSEVLISNQDAHLMRNYVWSRHLRNNGELYRNIGEGRQELLARRIMGCGEKEFICYINGNHLDVRRSNLKVQNGTERTSLPRLVRTMNRAKRG